VYRGENFDAALTRETVGIALGVARIVSSIATGFVMDSVDAALAPAVEALGLRTLVTDTLMTDDAARTRLAGEVLTFARSIRD
jgi:LPPG:FO 2-phospho-L-lactate transferase